MTEQELKVVDLKVLEQKLNKLYQRCVLSKEKVEAKLKAVRELQNRD